MINPTERARDALCGDRQTSASTTGILLKSELLVLKMLQVCRQSSAISLKPPETMNRINARHASGWEGNTELGQRALPGGPGQPSQQRIPLALVRIAQQPLACSCRAWSHRVRCLGVAEATGDVGRWQGQARGDGGELGAVQRCAGFPGPADGTHIARSRRPPSCATGQIPQKSPSPCLALDSKAPWSPLGLRASQPVLQSFSSPCAENHGCLQLYLSYRLSCRHPGSCSSCWNIGLCTQKYQSLHSEPHRTAWATPTAATPGCRYGQPGWKGSRMVVWREDPPTLVENVDFSLAVLQFSFWE